MSAPPLRLRVERLEHAVGLPLPAYATEGAAGLDLRAAVAEAVTLAPGERIAVPTGFRVEIPSGYEGQVRPRSGLALRHGVTVANAPGTIDSDYRGEVAVLLVNLSREAFEIRRGDRVAQLVVAPVARVVLEEGVALATTERGEGGFGSTGRH
ncbi:MAG: dUTP diphosphatase [Holophagales bacterium]|nr:dUTP diphosphatase [Holophagales bacterium]